MNKELEAFTPEEEAAMAAMQDEPVEDIAVSEPVAEPTEEPKEEQPPAEEAKAEEQPEPTSEPEDDSKPPQGFVPHQAMHKERMARQEAEKINADLMKRLEALEAAQPKPEPEPIPDQFADPEAYNAWVQKQAAAPMQELAQIREQFRQQQEFQQLNQMMIADEQSFSAETPDYKEAIDFGLNARADQLAIFSPNTPRAQLMQAAQQERVDVVRQAIANGQRPAEVLYKISQGFGYQKAKTPAETPAAAPTEAEKVQALANAQQATTSLSSASGASGAPELTMEYLAGLDEASFKKLEASRPEEVARALGA